MKVSKEAKERTIESILKALNWRGASMVFPIYSDGTNAVIDLKDLVKIIQFPNE